MKTIKFLAIVCALFAMASCSGNKQAADQESANEEAFYAGQPIESGIYDATYYDIKGKDSRKGAFDGRVIAAITPEQSVMYVYENGNRTKIKHLLKLDGAFEKEGDIYASKCKDLPVTLAKDSADYVLNYITNTDTVSITFDEKARSTYQPIEALKKIQEEVSK